MYIHIVYIHIVYIHIVLSVAHNIVVEGDLMVKMFLERLLCIFLVCRHARYCVNSRMTMQKHAV